MVSFPSSPIRLSSPSPPVTVSLPSPPSSVSLPPWPLIVSWPSPPRMLSPKNGDPIIESSPLPASTRMLVTLGYVVAVTSLRLIVFASSPPLTTIDVTALVRTFGAVPRIAPLARISTEPLAFCRTVMLSPPSELTNNSPPTNSAATDSSERSSIRSTVAGNPLVRDRRWFRPNECNQDLSSTAGNPFPDKRGPEYSLSPAESASGTDCATEFVPP